MKKMLIGVALLATIVPFGAFGEEARDEEVRDCAPNDPEINPGAEEICDGVDNNCDGEIDEGFVDTDGDGDADCVDDDDDNDGDGDEIDCDPLNPLRFPSNNEGCDGIDNDCDGEVDEDCPDLDGDGIANAVDDDDDGDGSPDSRQCYGRGETPIIYIFGQYLENGGWSPVNQWCPFPRGFCRIDYPFGRFYPRYDRENYENRVVFGRPPGAPSWVTRYIERRRAPDARVVPDQNRRLRDRAILRYYRQQRERR